MTRKILVRGARMIDPGRSIDEKRCLVIEDGLITGTPKRRPGSSFDIEIDGRGKWLLPGFIDLHVHLREPGEEHKETVETGAKAAAAGGFTTIVAMPNTKPPIDCAPVARFVQERAREAGKSRVLTAGAISAGLKGSELSEMGELRDAGCVIFTDDGKPVMNAGLMRRALEYSSGLGIPIMTHSEDLDLSRGGCMHEGRESTRLGLRGSPSAAEEVMIRRDIALLEEFGGRLHVAHVSTAGGIRAIREARKRGLPVTCECTPHHFTLTDRACGSYDPNTKMMPPLRSEEDRQALLEALREGDIQAISTDHAPHSSVEKNLEFDRAASGIIGLETAFSLALRLVNNGELSLNRAIELLSCGPADIIGIEAGRLSPGNAADFVLVDPDAAFTVDSGKFFSKSRNTPFEGWSLTGKIIETWVDGKRIF